MSESTFVYFVLSSSSFLSSSPKLFVWEPMLRIEDSTLNRCSISRAKRDLSRASKDNNQSTK